MASWYLYTNRKLVQGVYQSEIRSFRLNSSIIIEFNSGECFSGWERNEQRNHEQSLLTSTAS